MPKAASGDQMKRRFRYSLSSVLLLLTLSAIGIGLYSASARNQRRAVAELEAVGAAVQYDGQLDESIYPPRLKSSLGIDYFLPVVGVTIRDHREGRRSEPLPPEKWKRAATAMNQLPRLNSIKFVNTRLQDDDLALLAPLSGKIESLDFNEPWNQELTGEGLRHLAGWLRLKSLSLFIDQLDPSSLHHLAELPALESLAIRGTLDEEAFISIAQNQRLRSLQLSECWFDGRWLAKLSDAPQLKSITLRNCAPRFSYGGPFTVDMMPIEPVREAEMVFMFHPGLGMEPMTPSHASSPTAEELSEQFDKWLKAALPAVEVFMRYES